MAGWLALPSGITVAPNGDLAPALPVPSPDRPSFASGFLRTSPQKSRRKRGLSRRGGDGPADGAGDGVAGGPDGDGFGDREPRQAQRQPAPRAASTPLQPRRSARTPGGRRAATAAGSADSGAASRAAGVDCSSWRNDRSWSRSPRSVTRWRRHAERPRDHAGLGDVLVSVGSAQRSSAVVIVGDEEAVESRRGGPTAADADRWRRTGDRRRRHPRRACGRGGRPRSPAPLRRPARTSWRR